jgi:hypothetical protein
MASDPTEELPQNDPVSLLHASRNKSVVRSAACMTADVANAPRQSSLVVGPCDVRCDARCDPVSRSCVRSRCARRFTAPATDKGLGALHRRASPYPCADGRHAAAGGTLWHPPGSAGAGRGRFDAGRTRARRAAGPGRSRRMFAIARRPRSKHAAPLCASHRVCRSTAQQRSALPAEAQARAPRPTITHARTPRQEASRRQTEEKLAAAVEETRKLKRQYNDLLAEVSNAQDAEVRARARAAPCAKRRSRSPPLPSP